MHLLWYHILVKNELFELILASCNEVTTFLRLGNDEFSRSFVGGGNAIIWK